jgi:hypothetical protein
MRVAEDIKEKVVTKVGRRCGKDAECQRLRDQCSQSGVAERVEMG